jgi:3-polyprenyl-4-hydroxybenzoate decarboxylase
MALLFDKIKGYPDGYRVLINMFQTQQRTAESLGVAATLRGPAVDAIRKRMENHKPVPPNCRF